jgi:hypothetical protein
LAQTTPLCYTQDDIAKARCEQLKIVQPQFRDILQAVAGTHKGLIVQVVAVGDDGSADCLAKSFDGTPNFFKIPASDIGSWVRTGGMAALGPKPKGQTESPTPQLPPPLNPQELLEPLPPEVKAQPLQPEEEEPPPVMRKPEKYIPPKRRRITPTAANPFPKPPPQPRAPGRLYIARVQNALGNEAEVEVNVRGGDPNRHNGIASMRAAQFIPNVKPMKVLNWKPKETILVAPPQASAGV